MSLKGDLQKKRSDVKISVNLFCLAEPEPYFFRVENLHLGCRFNWGSKKGVTLDNLLAVPTITNLVNCCKFAND